MQKFEDHAYRISTVLSQNQRTLEIAFGGNLKSCKLRMRVKFNTSVQIYSVGFLHLQCICILALSPQVMVLLARHIQVWNQDSLGYAWNGVRVVQTTLQALFQSSFPDFKQIFTVNGSFDIAT